MGVINIDSGIQARKGKELIANALTSKGVPTSTTASFSEIASIINNSVSRAEILYSSDIVSSENDYKISNSNSEQKGSFYIRNGYISLKGPSTPYYNGDKNKTIIVLKKPINLTGKNKLIIVGSLLPLKLIGSSSTNPSMNGLRLLPHTSYNYYSIRDTPNIYQGMDISNYNGIHYLGFYDETEKTEEGWSSPISIDIQMIVLI